MMKRCSCGYLSLPDATRCPKCGRPIESAASTSNSLLHDGSAASSFLSVDECRAATEILDKGARILEARADEQEAGGDKRRADSTRGVAGVVLNVMDLLTNGTGCKDLWLAERSGWWNE